MKCKNCGMESLGLGWPKPDLCDKCHPRWQCSNCESIEYQEREITCWKCGIGNMNYLRLNTWLQWFKVWRRKPYKTALCRAYSDGVINSKQLHELAGRLDAV